MTSNVHSFHELRPRIIVMGVGGAGGNAVNNMIASGLHGVEFVAANTDAQALSMSGADMRLQLGVSLTEGLGAGSNPEIGEGAAEEVLEEVKELMSGAHMVFIACGMGGGTGTGAAPVIARIAQELGVLTVAVVTKPFQFEGQRRMRIAEAGIEQLRNYVDTMIVIPNQNLFRLANEQTTFAESFCLADSVLNSGVACVTDLIMKEGLINLDFADVKTVITEMGAAVMGTGVAHGEGRARKAAEEAISNPLIDDISLAGAKGLLISISGGHDMTLFEVDEVASRIRQEVDPNANIIVGATFDEQLEGYLRVSLVASGLNHGHPQSMHIEADRRRMENDNRDEENALGLNERIQQLDDPLGRPTRFGGTMKQPGHQHGQQPGQLSDRGVAGKAGDAALPTGQQDRGAHKGMGGAGRAGELYGQQGLQGQNLQGQTVHGQTAHGQTAHGQSVHGQSPHGQGSHGSLSQGHLSQGEAPVPQGGFGRRGMAKGQVIADGSAGEVKGNVQIVKKPPRFMNDGAETSFSNASYADGGIDGRSTGREFVAGAPQKVNEPMQPIRRMPSMEDLPITGQKQLKAYEAPPSSHGIVAQKKKVGFFDRITGRNRSHDDQSAEEGEGEPASITPVAPVDDRLPDFIAGPPHSVASQRPGGLQRHVQEGHAQEGHVHQEFGAPGGLDRRRRSPPEETNYYGQRPPPAAPERPLAPEQVVTPEMPVISERQDPTGRQDRATGFEKPARADEGLSGDEQAGYVEQEQQVGDTASNEFEQHMQAHYNQHPQQQPPVQPDDAEGRATMKPETAQERYPTIEIKKGIGHPLSIEDDEDISDIPPFLKKNR